MGRFQGLTLGSDVKFGSATWKVVGVFTADDAAFESEIWGDIDLMMPAFQRNGYQSMTVKLADPSMFDSFEAAIKGDPRLYLQPQREQDYYAEQSQAMTTVIRVFGTFVTLILSIGAMFGAMNTMYAAVAYRTREIGTLRALGFSQFRIVTAFLAESIALALVGGVIGCILALPVHGLSTGTTNFSSFTEVAFKFQNHAGPAGRRPGVFRGDGSRWRPAPCASRGPHPSRPSAARDLITCFQTSFRFRFSGLCR